MKWAIVSIAGERKMRRLILSGNNNSLEKNKTNEPKRISTKKIKW